MDENTKYLPKDRWSCGKDYESFINRKGKSKAYEIHTEGDSELKADKYSTIPDFNCQSTIPIKIGLR